MNPDSSIQQALVTRLVEDGRRVLSRAVGLALLIILSTVAMAADFGEQELVYFDIPQQRADVSLTQFAEQANLTLIFPYDNVRRKTANRLEGHYTVQAAVNILLAGTCPPPGLDERIW